MQPVKGMQAFLKTYFSIEPGENKLVQLFLVYFTLISIFYTVSIAVGETLFISQFNTVQLKVTLPWVYISIALVSILISWIYDHFVNSISRIKAIVYSDVIFVIAIFIMKFIIDIPEIGSWPYFLLIILLEAFSIFKITLCFSLMGDYFASHHAKRLYGYIINGMALGSITGGFIVAQLSYYTKVTNLLFLCIILIILSSLIAINISSTSVLKQIKKSIIHENPAKLNIILKNKYIKLVFILTVLIAIVGVIVDYTMLLSASERLNESGLAIFFGNFFFYIGICQLALELFIGHWLVYKFGVQRTLFILPVCILIACSGFFYSPILFFAAAINFVYLALTETIDLSTRQMLFLLLPTRIRVRSQSIADGIVASLGKITGGLAILFLSFFKFNIIFYAELTFLLSLLWITILLIIVPQYKKALSQSVMKPFLFAFEVISGMSKGKKKRLTLDNVSSTLINSLQNIDAHQQKLIINIMPKYAFDRYKTDISKLFAISKKSVIKQLLVLFGKYGANTDNPLIEPFLSDNRKSIQAAAIIAYAHINKRNALNIVAKYFTDTVMLIKCAAITASYKYCSIKGRMLAKKEILKILNSKPRIVVKLIGNLNIRSFYPALNTLLLSKVPGVQREAVIACQNCPHSLFIDNLVELLKFKNNLHPDILQALAKMPLSASKKFRALYNDQSLSTRIKGMMLQVMSRRGDDNALVSILDELSDRPHPKILLACYQSIKLFPENFLIKLSRQKYLKIVLNKLAISIMLQIKAYHFLGFLPLEFRQLYRDTINFYQAIYFSLLSLLYGFKEIDEMTSVYSGRDMGVSLAATQDVLMTIASNDVVLQVSHLKLPPETDTVYAPNPISPELTKSLIELSDWYKSLVFLCKPYFPIDNIVARDHTMNEEEMLSLNKIVIVTILKKTEIFRDIPAQELLMFADIAQEITCHPGETLFKEGDHGDCLYLIISGSVKIHINEVEIAVLGHNECIGELSLLDRLPRSATATILSKSRLLKINADDFLNLITLYPDISRRLLKILSLRLRNTTEQTQP